jgi:hypothetical protein
MYLYFSGCMRIWGGGQVPAAECFQFVVGGEEGGGGEECFVLEQPQDTAFVAKYKFPGAGFGSGSGAIVTLTDSA